MTIAYIVLGVSLGLPLVLGLMFRVSASHLFFAVMTGELLGRYFHHEVGAIAKSVFKTEMAADYSEVALVVIPIVLTAVFLMGTLSKGKVLLHAVPYVITGVVLAAFVLPILPSDIQAHVKTVPAGNQLLDTSNMIIGGVVILQLVALWILTRNEHYHKKKHGK